MTGALDLVKYQTFNSGINSIINRTKIDGTDLSDALFPINDVDFFVSHNHKDKIIAEKLCQFLEKLGFTTFIDERVWGSCDAVLNDIDKKYCRMESNPNNFDSSKRNRSTSHVHAMLSSALFTQIVHSKYLLVLNLDNSINNNENLVKSLESPWIYEEIIFARNIIWHEQNLNEEFAHFEKEPIPIFYKIDTSNFAQLNNSKLIVLKQLIDKQTNKYEALKSL
ncbi:MAG: toll/interleukin-1 receptor domain-containing protein [archaeon]|nr:toll/interleukin-1 receptor domain-containing protein [archaeon]